MLIEVWPSKTLNAKLVSKYFWSEYPEASLCCYLNIYKFILLQKPLLIDNQLRCEDGQIERFK